MEKLQIECNQYKLYSPDSLKYITDNMHGILLYKIEEYKKLFHIDNFLQFQINYFDDLENFRYFIYGLRGKKDSLPEYAQGTYDKGMINAFIQSNIVIDSPLYNSKLYMANHELFHLLYMKYILKNDFSKRIVWYDEGMAQFKSGEKDKLLNDDIFKEYYEHVREETRTIPDLNKLIHGSFFCNEYYNGYDLSYIAIRYLNELLNESDFIGLLGDFEQIKNHGKTIVNDMFAYYDKKFNLYYLSKKL